MKNFFNKTMDKKKALHLILIFILFYFSSLFQYIPIILLKINIKTMSNECAILLNLFSNLCMLTILFIIYRKALKKDFKNFTKNLYENLDIAIKYYLLGVLGMVITNLFINIVLQGGGSNNEKIVQNMIGTMPYLMILIAGIIAPIIEEIVFRKTYLDACKNKYLYLFLSSFIFGIMHILTSDTTPTIIDILYFIPYSCLGLSFAYMDYKQKNIFPSICMHILHNTLLIILSIIS